MYGYVYKTTYLKEGKIYVGQHKAEVFDENYYGSGVIISKLLKNHDKSSFKCEILCECYSEDELNEQEIYWIKELDARNPEIGYNIASGGAFGDSGYHMGMLGKKQSDKQKEAARKASSYKRSEEVRANMSKAHIGKPHKPSQLFLNGAFSGRHHTEETKKILSEKAKVQTTLWYQNATEEERKQRGNNISKSKKGAINITDGIKNYFIQPDKWPEYEQKGYFKMSLSRYKNQCNHQHSELLETPQTSEFVEDNQQPSL